MLAVQTAMDALRRSTSHTSDHPNILRQPSAEDLDAAHQLVSSARGERISPSRMNETTNLNAGGSPTALYDPNEGQDSRATGDVADREATAGFNQMCRYVYCQVVPDTLCLRTRLHFEKLTRVQ